MGLKWIFLINVIIGFAFSIVLCFIPETLPRLVIAKAAARSEAVDEQEAAILTSRLNVLHEMKYITTMTFRIMFTEPVVIFLGLYNGFAYGILFLYLDGVFDVFVVNNGLSYIGADLTYLNFVVGVVVMFLFVPVQTWFYARDRKKHGINRPEARFITSLVTVWLFPITLLWFAFTSDGSVSYWSPVVAGGVLGFADPLLWLSMLNYITGMLPLHYTASISLIFISLQTLIPTSPVQQSQLSSFHLLLSQQVSPISVSSCSTTCLRNGQWVLLDSLVSVFVL